MNRRPGLLLFVLILAGNVSAQIPYFQFYTLLRRNVPVQVNTIFQDKAGFIWCGSNRGLFSYDGINLNQWLTPDSISDNNITAIAQDSLGRIWTGHKNGSIIIHDGPTFVRFDPPEGLSGNEVSDILFDRRNNLWFSTLNDGLYYYTHERLYRLDEDEGMPDIFVYDLIEDPVGNIWAGTDGGVAVCTLEESKVTIRVLDYDHGLPDNIVKKVFIDDNNTVWLGTEDAGIISFDPATGRSTPLIQETWKYGSVTDFVLNGNQLWIASPQTGLIVYDREAEAGKVYRDHSGFDFLSIKTLHRDNEGNLWIGSRSGLTRTMGDRIEYIDQFDPYQDNNVLALTTDDNGALWYATVEGLFRRTVDDLGNATVVKMLTGTVFAKYTVISLYTDDAGYVWAGFYGEGALRINPRSRKIRHLSRELANGNILSITGRGTEVWLGTLGGASRIELAGEELSVKNYSSADGLVSDYIYQVFIDKDGRVWFATDGKGVAMMDARGFHDYTQGLGSLVVYGFAQDSTKTIWVNVQGEGIYRFDGQSFHPLTTDVPLRDKNVNSFAFDESGKFVMVHDLGIDIYDGENQRMYYLGDEVGMLGRRPNLNAIARDSLGRLLLGTEEGIVKLTRPMEDRSMLPQPYIASVGVMDQLLNMSGDVRLPYDENSLIIRYAGFWYQNPRGLNFQYRLENYNHDWIETVDRSVTYSSLPPGKYRFTLRVSDTEDFRNAKETAFSFVIRPPFWRTPWFYVALALALVYGTYAYIRRSERKLLLDKATLEGKVHERTLEIQKQSEEIQAQNEEIQSQAEEIQGINDNLESLVQARTAELEKKNKASEEAAFIIAHELRAPVASILGLINLISKRKVDKDTKVIIQHMEESAERLNKVVRNITQAIERGDR
jgi:ligand-binding sensor domain-containing protein